MDPREEIRRYHGARIRTLLKTSRSSYSHHVNSNDNALSSVNSTGLIAAKTDLTPLQVPEIFLMVLQFIPSHTYPALCRVSKLWCNLTKPQIWKSIFLNGDLALEQIAPYFSSNIDSTKRIDINLCNSLEFRNLSWLPRYFAEDRMFPNLTVIRIEEIIEETSQVERGRSFLSELTRRCPNLMKIDLRKCDLSSSYPLDFLHECPHLESLAFDISYSLEIIGISTRNVPLYHSGRYWPKLRHLHIRDQYDCDSFVDSLAANLFKSSFRLESLILEGNRWKANLLRHLMTQGPRPMNNDELRGKADKEPRGPMVSSLKLHDVCHTDVNLDKMPRLTKLGLPHMGLAISELLEEDACGRLVELTLCGSNQKDLSLLLSRTRCLRKLSVSKFVNGLMNGASAEVPRWQCLGLEELALCWKNLRESNPSMVLWKEIGNLDQLSVLRLQNCRVICDESIIPCPLEMLKNLDHLRHLEVTHSFSWSLQEVRCVAKFWPRLSLLEFQLSRMRIDHWSWLRQMRPFLFMEDLKSHAP